MTMVWSAEREDSYIELGMFFEEYSQGRCCIRRETIPSDQGSIIDQNLARFN